MEKKNCWDCGYYKEYVNHRKMEELNTEKVIFLHQCQNVNMPSEINDLELAGICKYYDDDSWMK